MQHLQEESAGREGIQRSDPPVESDRRSGKGRETNGGGIQIEQKAEQILNQIIDDSMTDVEKICAINTWMVENVTYDDGAIEERDKRD